MKNRISALLLAMLMSVSVLAACGNNDETVGDTDNSSESNIETTEDTNEATEDTDETMEDTDETIGENPDDSMEVYPATPVTSVSTPEDVVSFIDINVYGQVPDYLPMMVGTMPLDLSDADMIAYQTGLTDLTGIENIIWSESGVGSFAYSFLYVMTDGTNTDEIQTTLGNSVDPRKWVCVTAEKIVTVRLDNDVVLIMGQPEQVDAIMGAVVNAAEGIFENIGDVVAVMG